MLPFYAGDAQTRAADLASTVGAAVTPPLIASACAAVESFLHTHTFDQQRWFFSLTFPTLISRIFGFEDSSSAPRHVTNGGWMDVASSENQPELAGKIFSLLSPNGPLLSSIAECDRVSLVKYVFPSERLPEWCHYMLQSAHNCRILMELFPIFKSPIKEYSTEGGSYQVQLGIFDYYLFWFAYYPLYRCNIEVSEQLKVRRNKKFSFEHWSCSIPGLSTAHKGMANKKRGGEGSSLYMCLLHVYLQNLIPLRDKNVREHYSSSLLHYTPACDGSASERAEIFLDIIILFWLMDNDFPPLSKDSCKSLGVVLPFKSIHREIPPTPGTGAVINVFIKYLNLRLREAIEGSDQIESVGSLGTRSSDSFDVMPNRGFLSTYSVGSLIFNIQRPFYRYILRTFLFLSAETSIKTAYQAFSVWVDYLEPWSSSINEFADIYESIGRPAKSSVNLLSSSSGYSPRWRQYVLENYLFYTSLVVHFIGFAHRFLHTDIELTLKMVSKVMNILTASSELRDLVKNVEAVFHAKGNPPSKSTFQSYFSKYIPTIQQRLHDWEDGLCESDADGSFLHEKWNKDLRLFVDGDDGGQQLLQLLVVRAESEIHSASESINLSKDLESLKSRLNQLFGGCPTRTSSEKGKATDDESRLRCEVFTPRTSSNQM
ncbi:hypothetical protein M569_08179, partial [Genlisea aurea]